MKAHQKQIVAGFIFGTLLWLFCLLLFLLFLTPFDLADAPKKLMREKIFGKVMVVSAIPNVLLFFYFLKLKRDHMAKGILFFAIVLTLITLFVS